MKPESPIRWLRVRVFEPPFRWHVQSESEPQFPHLVDLLGYAGNGECSCKHFLCRMAPELKQGRKPTPATRCKHIRAAREALINNLIRQHLHENEPAQRQSA